MGDRVVKVDSELLNLVEKFVKENKLVFSSKKQVINLALVEFLKSHNIKVNIKGG